MNNKNWKISFESTKAIDTENYVVIPRPIMSNFMQFSWIFLLCNNGNGVSTEFDQIANAYFHCSWYLMPRNLQKAMIHILAYSNITTDIASFGGLACDRGTFNKVFMRCLFLYK